MFRTRRLTVSTLLLPFAFVFAAGRFAPRWFARWMFLAFLPEYVDNISLRWENRRHFSRIPTTSISGELQRSSIWSRNKSNLCLQHPRDRISPVLQSFVCVASLHYLPMSEQIVQHNTRSVTRITFKNTKLELLSFYNGQKRSINRSSMYLHTLAILSLFLPTKELWVLSACSYVTNAF